MSQLTFMLAYCLFCVAVSVVTMRFLKTWWVYFLVAATSPPMIVVGADALWRGSLSVWADIAFVVAWGIAFGCALGYYLIRLAIRRIASESKHQ